MLTPSEIIIVSIAVTVISIVEYVVLSFKQDKKNDEMCERLRKEWRDGYKWGFWGGAIEGWNETNAEHLKRRVSDELAK